MSAFSKTDQAIRDMIEDALLQTKMARAIARKSGIFLRGDTQTFSAGATPDLWGAYATIDFFSGGHSSVGSIIQYGAVRFSFPPPLRFGAAPSMARYADFKGVDEVQMLVTVTQAGPAGSTMNLTLERDTDPEYPATTIVDVDFVGGSPEIPLDEVALHISDWVRIDWGDDPVDIFGELPAYLRWWIDDPDETFGTVGLGLCQLRVRGDLDSGV